MHRLGPVAAVPIMGIAAMMADSSRIVMGWLAEGLMLVSGVVMLWSAALA